MADIFAAEGFASDGAKRDLRPVLPGPTGWRPPAEAGRHIPLATSQDETSGAADGAPRTRVAGVGRPARLP